MHGDLLGQNILVDPDGSPSVIDWEYAQRGDPAHDLAIVTRGVRRPFQVERGLEKLLEAYHRHGGTGVTIEQVRLHELCRWPGGIATRSWAVASTARRRSWRAYGA